MLQISDYIIQSCTPWMFIYICTSLMIRHLYKHSLYYATAAPERWITTYAYAEYIRFTIYHFSFVLSIPRLSRGFSGSFDIVIPDGCFYALSFLLCCIFAVRPYAPVLLHFH